MKLESVIGLEIHVQLKTKSKMFCGCSNDGEHQSPNTTVCEVCLGHPGVLPVPNQTAIEWSAEAALALNCEINKHQHFDRKHYFYPDLPKAYQISQLDEPIGEHGYLEVRVPMTKKQVAENDYGDQIRIGITRLHLEEDAAKNMHGDDGKMWVDYNRGGTPLMEIVSEPDIPSPQAAKAFLQELRLIMRYLDLSDADMEKGHLRCDANISLRPEGDSEFYPKTEIKNLNSFKAVERALEHEIQRQTKLWESDNAPSEQSTRGWDESSQTTREQRTKEGSADYRYFPEPDIPPLEFTDEVIAELGRKLGELPIAKRERFIEEYNISYTDAKIIVEDKNLASYFEHVISELQSWLASIDTVEGTAEEVWEQNKKKLMKLVSGWLINKLGSLMADKETSWKDIQITPENFAEFITLMHQNKLNSASGQKVLEQMLETGADPSHIIEEGGMEQVSDEGELELMVDAVLANNPDEVEKYKAGKVELIQFFMGQVMKESKGRANPASVTKIIKTKLQ